MHARISIASPIFPRTARAAFCTIKVPGRSRERSAALAHAYVDELNKLVAQLSTSAARREREFIETRLQSVKQELDTAAQEFSQYASKNTAVDITAQERAMVPRAANYAQSELEGLQQIYTDNNIRVKTLRARDTACELRTGECRMGDNRHSVSSIEKLSALGWRPQRNLGNILEDFLAWLDTQSEVLTSVPDAYSKMNEAGVVLPVVS